MPNGVDTLPFGHYSLRDDVVLREINADDHWGEEEEGEEEEDMFQQNQSPTQAADERRSIFSPPGPGFNQTIQENEIEDIIDLTHLSDNEEDTNSIQSNIFLDLEATEECPPPPKRGKLHST